jgi:uncharacterized damage-inducible protein DinB
MKETARLQKLFTDLYDADPWLDVTLVGTLSRLNAQQAAYKPSPDWNSIWEITNHLIAWRENVLGRVNGQTLQSPSHNYFIPVDDTSDTHWRQSLQKLEKSQQAWLDFLGKMNADDLEKSYPPNDHSYADHIHGILQHDAYHLGQIVMLAKHAVK